MRTINPIRGLLIYSFHAVSGNWAIALSVCIVLTGILLVTGDYAFFILLGMGAILAPPILVLINMGSISKWERFQLSMPVTRSNLVSSQYLEILLSSFVGFPFLAVIAAAAHILHVGIFYDFTVVDAVEAFSVFWVMPLLTAGFCFPLACTRIGERSETVIVILSIIAASLLPNFVTWVGERLGFYAIAITLLLIAISLIIFVVSYFITRKLYAIRDF